MSKCYVWAAVFMGCIAIVADLLIRQTVVYHLVEKGKIPTECVQYRKTSTHLISVFVLGALLYVAFHLFGLHE